MKSFNVFINESTQEKNANDLVASIEASFKSHFKDSYINVKFTTNLSSAVSISFALGKDKTEFKNGIFENDPIAGKMLIFGFKKDGTIDGKLEADKGAHLSIADPTGRLHSQTVKVFRKISGDYAKVAKGFDSYFAKMHKTIKDNLEGVQSMVDFDVSKKL